jgi:hypothetical protein
VIFSHRRGGPICNIAAGSKLSLQKCNMKSPFRSLKSENPLQKQGDPLQVGDQKQHPGLHEVEGIDGPISILLRNPACAGIQKTANFAAAPDRQAHIVFQTQVVMKTGGRPVSGSILRMISVSKLFSFAARKGKRRRQNIKIPHLGQQKSCADQSYKSEKTNLT